MQYNFQEFTSYFKIEIAKNRYFENFAGFLLILLIFFKIFVLLLST